jgi:PEP-CTERM motif
MSLRPCFLRMCCSRAIPGLLLTLAFSSTAFSQQIPCPVTTPYTNSSPAANNSATPCNINANFTNGADASLENFGALVNNATFTNSSGATLFTYGTFTNSSGATLDNNAGATLLPVLGSFNNDLGATVNNDGVITGQAVSATMNNGGTFNNNSGATLTVTSSFTDSGILNNSGTIILKNSGNLNDFAGLIIPTGGVVNNSAGGTFQQTTGAFTLLSGEINSSTTLQIQGGAFGGTGTVNGDVVIMGGDISPGPENGATGILTINGFYGQTAPGNFFAIIGGLNAGTQYDQLVVNGTVSLSGGLGVVDAPGFTPTSGDSFVLMTYDGESGTFHTLSLPPLTDDENWVVTYGANDLTLSVRTPEPSSMLLLGAGLVAMLGLRRKRGFVIPT